MIWLTWRQQRLETAMTAALLAIVAALLVPLGIHMADVFAHDNVAACAARTASNGLACSGVVDGFVSRFEHAGPFIPWLNFVPGLFGVLFAAPLVLELEQGTYRLAWTQSVTRRRWLTVKLATIFASAMLCALALVVLMTWWRQPLDALEGRMEPNVFDFEGVVPLAYAAFAVSLVVALGVFTRRTIVAIGGAMLGYFGLRIAVQTWVRVHYMAPVKAVWPVSTEGPRHLDQAWKTFSGPGDAHGHVLPNGGHIVAVCMSGSKQAVGACLSAHHVFNLAVYQPASRFWAFQGIESAIFIGLASILLAAAVWWLRHRIS